MIVTENDIVVLKALAEFYVLTRSLLHRICFPQHRDGRATRKRLSRLVYHGYVGKLSTPVAFPGGNSGPAYFPTAKGNEMLSVWFDDERYLAVNTRVPRRDLIFHWLAITEIHWIVKQAVVRQDYVFLDGWYTEWETVNKSDADPDRFYLHTQLRDHPPLSCSPDAAFMLSVGEFRRVFYVEADRGTSGVRHVAASKMSGYAELFRQQLHRRHFPKATLDDFKVLCITTDPSRRDALANAVAIRTDNEPGLWFFIDRTEMTPNTFLYGDIAYNCHGKRGPLVKNTGSSHATKTDPDAAD